jgi:hypothetical protein
LFVATIAVAAADLIPHFAWDKRRPLRS